MYENLEGLFFIIDAKQNIFIALLIFSVEVTKNYHLSLIVRKIIESASAT